MLGAEPTKGLQLRCEQHCSASILLDRRVGFLTPAGEILVKGSGPFRERGEVLRHRRHESDNAGTRQGKKGAKAFPAATTPPSSDLCPRSDSSHGGWKRSPFGKGRLCCEGNRGIRSRLFSRTSDVLWVSIGSSTRDDTGETLKAAVQYLLPRGDALVDESGDNGYIRVWKHQVAGISGYNHSHRMGGRRTNTIAPSFWTKLLRTRLTLPGLNPWIGVATTIPNLSRMARNISWLSPTPRRTVRDRPQVTGAQREAQYREAAQDSARNALRNTTPGPDARHSELRTTVSLNSEEERSDERPAF